MTTVRLRRADAGDIAFIMAAERGPGFERFIGQWSEERHRETMAHAANAYLLGLDGDGMPAGFAILRELDDARGNVYLQRIVAAEPGRGFGRALLAAVTDFVFRETRAFRLWFHMAAENDRAHHVYVTSGFTVEGRLRQSRVTVDGTRGDALLLSMLRPEWPSRRRSATN